MFSVKNSEGKQHLCPPQHAAHKLTFRTTEFSTLWTVNTLQC